MPPVVHLIKKNGQPRYGYFHKGVSHINYLDFDWRTTMDKKRGQLAKRFGFNQFQFISFISDHLIIGLAIVDLKLISNAFLYVYDTQTQVFKEFSFLNAFAVKTRIEPSPNNGISEFKKGSNRFIISASTTPGLRRVDINIGNELSLTATIDELTTYNPLAICTRAGYNGWVFTQKSAAQICTGQLTWNKKIYNFEELGMLAGVDWTGGYMRRETFWNWASLSCRLHDGRTLGFNLAAGVNETSFSENAIWLDGRLIKVDMVEFQFDRHHPEHSWEIRSNDGTVQLHFTPIGQRRDKTNAFIIASNFTQHFGRYSGEIRLSNETILLEGEWGLTEDHYAKW